MAKAALTLQNGTVVQIEGTVEEVRGLLEFYGSNTANAASIPRKSTARKRKRKPKSPNSSARTEKDDGDVTPNLSKIVTLTKDCDEAESIERQILDRASQVDRTLLPLYIVYEYLENRFALSSGEISKITSELGVPVSVPNTSRTLSGTAARYVIGDRVRRRGQGVRYKLSRRGIRYMKAVIGGEADENAG